MSYFEFDTAQATLVARLDADSFFSGLGMVARKGFSARFEVADDLKADVETDLEEKGVCMVVGVPSVESVGDASSGRSMMGLRMNVDLVENATVNRGNGAGAIGVPPQGLAAQVFKALLGHPQIKPYPDECYREFEDKEQGLDIYRCSFLTSADLIPRGP